SAGRQNTFSAPHISSSRRTSELGAVFTGRATRGGPGEWGWARAGGALGRGRRPGQNTAARVGGGQRPGCRSRPALDPGTGPRVGLVLEVQDPLAAAAAADGAEEDHHAAKGIVADERERVVDGKRRLAHRDGLEGSGVPTRHRGDERDFVAVREWGVDFGVVAV